MKHTDKFLTEAEKSMIKKAAEECIKACGITDPIKIIKTHQFALESYIEGVVLK